jgi:cytochrome c2
LTAFAGLEMRFTAITAGEPATISFDRYLDFAAVRGAFDMFKRLSMVAMAFLITSAPALAAGDADKGKSVFNKCKACHVVNAEKNRIGPHLVGLFGRTAGSLESYKYSKSMKESGIVWNAETLDAYLKNPRQYVKGTRMAFAGLKKDSERDDVIAYLREVTKP